jgi:DNA-binding MarR family transcriptional regulator
MTKECPLNSDLLVVLHDVARLIRTRFDQRARTYGMTRAQWIILLRLERQPGLSQNELAGICEVEPITVGRLIDRLEKQGLVERRADPSDRRVHRLHLLPAATPLLAEISMHRQDFRDEIMADLSEETRQALLTGLLQIKEKLTTDPVSAKAAGGAG